MNTNRYYSAQHPYYCGVDLHARSLFVCVLDSTGQTKLSQNLPATRGRMFNPEPRSGVTTVAPGDGDPKGRRNPG